MVRTFRTLGLALVAVLAFSAFAASSANATQLQRFTADEWPVVFTGSQTTQHTFTAGGLGLICTTASFHGTQAGHVSTTATVKATYSNCHEELFELSATVTMNTCAYTIEDVTSETGEEHKYTAKNRIHCSTPGDKIVVHAGTCTLTIPEQTVGGLTFTTETNATSERDLLLHIDTTNEITYTEHDGFLCPLTGDGLTTHNGSYTGTSTVIGEEEGANPDRIGIDIVPDPQ